MMRILIPLLFVTLANVVLLPYKYIYRPQWVLRVDNEWLLTILYSFPSFFTAYCMSFLFLIAKSTCKLKNIYSNTWVIVVLTFNEYNQNFFDWKDIIAIVMGTFLAIPLMTKLKQKYC